MLVRPVLFAFAILGNALPVAAQQNGPYTAAQAARGKAQFGVNCGECHGREAEGDVGPPLAGGGMSAWGDAAAMYEVLSTVMPPTSPGRLQPRVYADILAYLLSLNGVTAGTEELQPDPEKLKAIALMPKK